MDNKTKPTKFTKLNDKDKDLTMFTITNLNLAKEDGMVYMTLNLKRKVATELLTTYLPTILLLLITFVTIFFDPDLFADAIAVNLTIMLVMTTIFTSKIEELPPTSDMKMIDIWLIFCLVVPFTEVILRTAIECMKCSCHLCEPKDDKVGEGDKEEGGGEIQQALADITFVRVGTGAKVAPEQVAQQILRMILLSYLNHSSHDQDKERPVSVEAITVNDARVGRPKCWRWIWSWCKVIGKMCFVNSIRILTLSSVMCHVSHWVGHGVIYGVGLNMS